MDVAVREQVELAVDQSQLIVFVVDGKEGLSPVDREIAAHLRRAGRPVLLTVNKLDDYPATSAHLAFYELGLGDPLPISASVGKASGDLDAIAAHLPPDEVEDATPSPAVVGRPTRASPPHQSVVGENRWWCLPSGNHPGCDRHPLAVSRKNAQLHRYCGFTAQI
jgi:GTP-binding protein